jgi:protein-tyrosine kinase
LVAQDGAHVEITASVEKRNVLAVEGASPVPARGEGASPVPARGEPSIGAILVRAGRLSIEDAGRILRLQREQDLRFGEAAIKLELLTKADIDFALAHQFDRPYLVRGDSDVSEQVVTAYEPLSPQSEALGRLRTELMLRWFDGSPGRNALAIVSAERGDGRSFLAANLAVAFSQLGQTTLLIDADMRNPTQHILFNLGNRSGLSAMLSGRGQRGASIWQVPGLPGLSIMPAGATPPNPAELLARPVFAQLLGEMAQEFEVVLFDSAPAAEYADARAIAVRCGAALLIARKNATHVWRMRSVSEALTDARTIILGAVLNDF